MTYDELNFEGDRESHRDGTCRRSNRDKAADNQMFIYGISNFKCCRNQSHLFIQVCCKGVRLDRKLSSHCILCDPIKSGDLAATLSRIAYKKGWFTLKKRGGRYDSATT